MSYLRLLQARRGLLWPDDGTGGGGGPGDPGPDSTPEGGAEGKPDAPVDFAALLKNKAFQAEFDKRVDKAVTTHKANWEREAQERIKTAKTEGEKLARLSAEERARVEAEQRVADILAREETMATREAEIMRRELRAEALNTLEQKWLPCGLADMLVYTDAEACNASIEAAEKVFRQAVQVGVDARLKPKEMPKGGGGDAAASVAAMRAAAGLPPKT